jgi:hypothetical protein
MTVGFDQFMLDNFKLGYYYMEFDLVNRNSTLLYLGDSDDYLLGRT